MSIDFFVPGIPVAKGSMRAYAIPGGRVGMTNDSKKTKPWQADVKHFASQAWTGPPLPKDVAVDIDLRFWLVRPRSVSAKRRPCPVVKPDVDKLARCILDALTGVCFVDDSQVVALGASKKYSDVPGVDVWISART
jgi:crossover junction endodeoxyribonuclease RusA